MEFRLADCEDIPILGRHAYLVAQGGGFQQPSPALLCQTVVDAVYSGCAFVVVQNGSAVGSVCVKWHPGMFASLTAEIFSLWLEKGLPTRTVYRFMAWVCEQLRERGIQQFVLTEAAGSPHKAFAKCGFQSVAVVKMGDSDTVLTAIKEREQ